MNEFLTAVQQLRGAGVHSVRIEPACDPPCGVRYRGRLDGEFLHRDVLDIYAPRMTATFERRIGERLHVEIPSASVVFDGIPLWLARGLVWFEVLRGARHCSRPGCGHAETEHYQAVVRERPLTVEPRCRACDEASIVEIAGHEFASERRCRAPGCEGVIGRDGRCMACEVPA